MEVLSIFSVVLLPEQSLRQVNHQRIVYAAVACDRNGQFPFCLHSIWTAKHLSARLCCTCRGFASRVHFIGAHYWLTSNLRRCLPFSIMKFPPTSNAGLPNHSTHGYLSVLFSENDRKKSIRQKSAQCREQNRPVCMAVACDRRESHI